MVRRQGKKPVLAREEKKKREWVESLVGLDGLGAREPKRRRGGEQRLETHGPGSPLIYSLI
jgi:ABC-type thiamine transport system ATPase subunit